MGQIIDLKRIRLTEHGKTMFWRNGKRRYQCEECFKISSWIDGWGYKVTNVGELWDEISVYCPDCIETKEKANDHE